MDIAPPSPTMRAIVVAGTKGPADALREEQVAVPAPSGHEVLVKVRAIGLNRGDLLQREGLYPPPPGASDILGLEVAGEVVTPGGRWLKHDRVCALLGGGGYAEYVAVDHRHLFPLPHGFDFVAGSALPEAIATVFVNIFERARLAKGETFMVHGGNSGIGVTAIQMAKAAGATVVATVRGPARVEALRNLGADRVIDVTAEDFLTAARALKHGGRIAIIGLQAGPDASLPLMALMRKRATVTGSTLRDRAADEKSALIAKIERIVLPWVASGKVRAVVDRIFPLAAAAAAHAHMERGGLMGKVVLTVD